MISMFRVAPLGAFRAYPLVHRGDDQQIRRRDCFSARRRCFVSESSGDTQWVVGALDPRVAADRNLS